MHYNAQIKRQTGKCLQHYYFSFSFCLQGCVEGTLRTVFPRRVYLGLGCQPRRRGRDVTRGRNRAVLSACWRGGHSLDTSVRLFFFRVLSPSLCALVSTWAMWCEEGAGSLLPSASTGRVHSVLGWNSGVRSVSFRPGEAWWPHGPSRRRPATGAAV